MRLLAVLVLIIASIGTHGGTARAEVPTLRIAVLKFGTVNWLTSTITVNRLDEAAGYRLEVVELAGKPATSIAFRSGDVDIIVTDWVWALQQRDRGLDLRFAPYSVALGAVMTRGGVDGICDLRGRPVGVVGGESDKSWLVLQALVQRECGFGLAEETQALVGAAPLMSQQLREGSVDAVSTYWPEAAKLEAEGMARLIGVDEAVERLGITPPPALIGFVWDAGRERSAEISAFLQSVAAAQDLLAADDAEWDRLRPQMLAPDDTAFILLRDHFRAGIAHSWRPEDTEAARQLQQLLIETGGEVFEAEAGTFDPALFETQGGDGG